MRISDWSSDVCSSDLRGRRLAYPALLVRDRDPDHDYPRFFGTIRPPNRPAPTNIRLYASVRLCYTWKRLCHGRGSNHSSLTAFRPLRSEERRVGEGGGHPG